MSSVGIDIIETERLKKALSTKGFKQRIFLENEIAYCEQFNPSYERYAGMFACKEAVMKACKTAGQYFKDIEVAHSENGSPKIIFHGYFASNFDQSKIDISISHVEKVGIAIAIYND